MKNRKNRVRSLFSMPSQLVVIGDLNANVHALRHTLKSLQIIDKADRWLKSDVHVVQLGDVLNRGPDSKQCFDLLMQWNIEAKEHRSQMTTILGNHEVMVMLGNYSWCYPEEMQSFATDSEFSNFEQQRSEKMMQLLNDMRHHTQSFSILGELRAWECKQQLGIESFKKAYSAQGLYGQWLRTRPIAVRVGSYVLSHAGLLPAYAELGLPRLNRLVTEQWQKNPQHFEDLPYKSPLSNPQGPLWNRLLAGSDVKKIKPALEKSLSVLNAQMMILGHTRTEVVGGQLGEPLLRAGGQILCADTSIGTPGIPTSVVLIEGEKVYSWSAGCKKRLQA